jgi:hypothetical protein
MGYSVKFVRKSYERCRQSGSQLTRGLLLKSRSVPLRAPSASPIFILYYQTILLLLHLPIQRMTVELDFHHLWIRERTCIQAES